MHISKRSIVLYNFKGGEKPGEKNHKFCQFSSYWAKVVMGEVAGFSSPSTTRFPSFLNLKFLSVIAYIYERKGSVSQVNG